MKKEFAIIAFFSLGIAFFLFGCQADPADKVVFLKHPEMMKKYDFLPFQKAWKDSNVNLKSYNKIIVEPVYTAKRIKKNEIESTNLDSLLGAEKEKALAFIDYTENAFKKAIDEDTRLQLVTKPGPNTMILQLALVKVVPGKPILGAFKNIPVSKIGFIITPATSAVGGSVDGPLQSSVAIEGRFLDSQSKKVIAKFADREKETTALFNAKDFSAYGTPKQIVDEWAKLVVKCLNREPGEKIKEPSNIKLINY
jgi:uncharacterized protein DUF3313